MLFVAILETFHEKLVNIKSFWTRKTATCKYVVFIAEEPENMYEKKKASEIMNENLWLLWKKDFCSHALTELRT